MYLHTLYVHFNSQKAVLYSAFISRYHKFVTSGRGRRGSTSEQGHGGSTSGRGRDGSTTRNALVSEARGPCQRPQVPTDVSKRSVKFPSPTTQTPKREHKKFSDFENSFRREKVSQPSGSSSEGSRKRAKDSPLDEASRAPPKRPTRREYEDEDSCSLLAVRFSDGRGELGANGMVSLQQGLWALIDEIGGPSALKMGGVRNRGGTVVVQCQDAFTKIWLEDKIPKLGGGVYSVSGWAPTWVKGSVWIPGQDLPDSKDIFQKISLHNNGLDTATWFTVTKPIRAGRGHLLVLRMDETSARFCSSNKIYYYTERLDFRFVRPITAEVKSSSSSSHNVDAT